MAQDINELAAQVGDHFRSLPTQAINTPIIDTRTYQLREETMTLYTAFPPREMQIDSGAIKIKDSAK